MITIKTEDIEKFELMSKVEIIDRERFQLLQALTTEYVDSRHIICRNCDAQIRYAYQTLMNFYARYNEQSKEEIVEPNIEEKPANEQVEEYIQASKKNKTANCAKCGNIFVKNNNKHKFCEDCKR